MSPEGDNSDLPQVRVVDSDFPVKSRGLSQTCPPGRNTILTGPRLVGKLDWILSIRFGKFGPFPIPSTPAIIVCQSTSQHGLLLPTKRLSVYKIRNCLGVCTLIVDNTTSMWVLTRQSRGPLEISVFGILYNRTNGRCMVTTKKSHFRSCELTTKQGASSGPTDSCWFGSRQK